MRLLVVSSKRCWPSQRNDGSFVVIGGFARQIDAIASLFLETRVVLMAASQPRPPKFEHFVAPNLFFAPLREPRGQGWIRKLSLPSWCIRNGPRLWREIKKAEAVHIPVPGDVGFIALIAALCQRKDIFVRHCGTWADRSTVANRLLTCLLPRIAGERVVVMATGGAPQAPDRRNPSIQWIFSTSLHEAEIDAIEPSKQWHRGEPLRLVTVGRLTEGKNALACIEALPEIRAQVAECRLSVVGDGPFRAQLERAVEKLGLGDVVDFTGNLNHEGVMDTLRRSHVFLFPTKVAEGFPKAVLEAMACGLPVVASRVSVLPYLLDGGAGELLDGTGAKDVARAVIGLIDEPDEMASKGLRARDTAREYTLERWRDLIRERLEAAWGRPLKEQPVSETGADLG